MFTNTTRRYYINHALDQFLEHLIKIGIDKIIQIGGQSKSIVLKGKNLCIVSKDKTRTKSEGYLCAMMHKALEVSKELITKQLQYLHSRQKHLEQNTIKRYLAMNYSHIHAQFTRVDDDGFKMVNRSLFDIWANNKSEATKLDEIATQLVITALLLTVMQDVYCLSWQERC